MTRPTRPLIIIIKGFPGVGKLTIAKRLIQTFPNGRLFDNHLLIDPASSILEREDEAYYSLRKAFRAALFRTLTEYPASIPPVLIFTECQSTDDWGQAVMNEYMDFAKTVNAKLISIILECSTQDNEKRLMAQDRMMERGTKLRDISVLNQMRRSYEIHRFGELADKEWVIDTTCRTAQDTADDLISKILSSQ
ncbi:uncharacterized protein I206_102013 [Kwoniella pini CBS 10737]|uniref:AAA domain-containing protein n=1 Tax=Kwoniella pini CBS 10737 TaxID=1296096 RepID=A0AAJ8MNZ3_9TREE